MLETIIQNDKCTTIIHPRKDKNFEKWLKSLNNYGRKYGAKSDLFEDDEFTRELYEDREKVHNAFQELMRE